jgi:CDP-diacylglycerol--glycerol-3-phosphate 3-phosphatidyltransferase
MFDGRWRDTVDRGTGPVGRKLQQVGMSADVLTATGLISAAATAVAVATGRLHLAIVLLILTGLHDLLDGPVAKASGTSSVRGAFFDSVTDRVADALILGGIAWYLVSSHPGHLALLPFAVLAVTSLVSYQRAKAESLGIQAKGGLMERAERMILLGIAFISASFLVPVLWLMLVLTSATALGRFAKVWRLAEAPPTPGPRRVRRTRTGVRTTSWGTARTTGRSTSTSASRWRARRQGELSSRSGRTWRARQARSGVRQRAGRRHG